MPFSITISCTSFVQPGVGATAHALLRLSVLMSELLPTFGWPITPIVIDGLTRDGALASDGLLGLKPLMSSMSGLMDDPAADDGSEPDEDRCARCCCVDDLKGRVGA